MQHASQLPNTLETTTSVVMDATGMMPTQDTAESSTLKLSRLEKNAADATEAPTSEMPAEILMKALAVTPVGTDASGMRTTQSTADGMMTKTLTLQPAAAVVLCT